MFPRIQGLKFTKEHGIRHQTTVPHSPAQNGVAERANRTIMEKARCMLFDAALDKRFWAEAVNTAVYLKNRSPTKAVKGATPEETWTKKKFHSSSSDKRSQVNDCGENSVSIVEEKKIEDDSSDSSSSGEHVEIEEKSLPLVDPPPLVVAEESHSAQCSCPNCDEILSRFSECSICLEPLQCCGPCVCPWCGGVWCARCSRRMARCAWCRGALRAPAPVCAALQRLLNDLSLPCRNYRRGCTELLTANTRTKHEEDCKFDTMICPITANCCSVPFDELASHLQTTHNIIAVYSQKIKILIENFQTKLKKTACCRTKYKIVLLHQKSAFIIKVCIYNYHVRVEVMRRKLGYIADVKQENKKSEYCALVEFQSKALSTKSAIMIENETYGKKAEVQWNDVVMKADSDEAITIHVNIGKTEAEVARKVYIET